MTQSLVGVIASAFQVPSGWDRDDAFTYADQTAFDAAWISNDTANIRGSPTNDNIAYTGANLSDEGIYTDIIGSNVSDTAWVCRYIWDMTAFTKGTNNVLIGQIQDSTSVDTTTAIDGCGWRITGSGNFFDAENCDNEAPTAGSGVRFSWAPAVDLQAIEQIRLSATTATLEIFDDTGFSTSREASGTMTIDSTTDGLRYFSFRGLIVSATNNGAIEPNFQFADGVTTAP